MAWLIPESEQELATQGIGGDDTYEHHPWRAKGGEPHDGQSDQPKIHCQK